MTKVPVLDWLSWGTIFAALAGLLPPIAALVGAIYYIILIYESRTLKEWRQRRRLERLARLEAKAAAIRKAADLRE